MALFMNGHGYFVGSAHLKLGHLTLAPTLSITLTLTLTLTLT